MESACITLLVMLDPWSTVVQWTLPYNCWQVFDAEVQALLSQISYGAGMPFY